MPRTINGSGSPTERPGGTIRPASYKPFNATVGDLAYVNVFNAGHMALFDQQEASLDLIARRISNKALKTA